MEQNNKDMESITVDASQDKEEELGEMEFWVCYKKNGDKFNYLGDGKGHIRLFKTKSALVKYLAKNFEVSVDIHIDKIKGNFAVPQPEEEKRKALTVFTPNAPIPPSATEILNEWKKKRKRMA